MMVNALPNFVLATTLLNQGPAALGAMVEAQPELSADDEEARALLMAVSGFASRLTLGDLTLLGDGRRGNKDLLTKVRSFASQVTRQPGYDRSWTVKGITEELQRLPQKRLDEIAAQTKSAGLSLFAPEQTMAKARAALGAAPAVSSATNDLSDDPKVGDRAMLASLLSRELFHMAYYGNAQALLRLIYKAESDEGAAYFVKQLSNPEGTKLEQETPLRICHALFQMVHVQAMQTALKKLDKGDTKYRNLNAALDNLRKLRPDLFTDSGQ